MIFLTTEVILTIGLELLKYFMMSFRILLIIPRIIILLVTLQAHSQTTYYSGTETIVGQVQYGVVDENCNDLHDLARQYNIGFDTLLLANPQLNPETTPQPGMVVYIPNQTILPKKIKPNTITVNLPEKRLFFYDQSQKRLWIFPVGIGRLDHATPRGQMYVTQKRYRPIWNVPAGVLAEAHANGYIDHPKIMPAGPNNPLGDYAVHLSANTYLIHSTHNPDLIGTRNTSGCINLYPEHLAFLFKKISVSTPVEVLNTPLKMHYGDNTVYIERHPVYHLTEIDQESFDTHSHHTANLHQVMIFYDQHQKTPHHDNLHVDKANHLLQNLTGFPIAVITE